MKTITIDEFKTIVASNAWQHEQEHEIMDSNVYEDVIIEEDYEDEDGDPVRPASVTKSWGLASRISNIVYIDSFFGSDQDLKITVTYTEGFQFENYEPDTLETYTEGVDLVWVIDGISVVGEDGNQIDDKDLAGYLTDSFSHIDYSFLDDKLNATNDIDLDNEKDDSQDDDDSDMETYILQIDNAPDIRFTGYLLGSASSTDNNAAYHSYSGETGRWAELELYKTKGGKYVCHQVGRTRWQGERDRFSGKVCETVDEVKKYFGHRWLAKELYDDAGIDAAVEVD